MARVDVGAVERNCRLLDEKVGEDTALCAVVKADGYGHGAEACARAALKGGARWLAVASAAEVEELREELPKRTRLLTMGALTRKELKRALEARSDVSIWDPDFLELTARTAARVGEPARVHVKYDSGMGRLGERDPDSAFALVERCAEDQHLKLIGFWTHFATADEPEPDYFEEQLARFTALGERVRSAHPRCMLHAANSAATLREPAAHFDMVRCGIAVYGLDPYHAFPVDRGLEPALSLHSWIAAVKRFPAGASAGYGRRWRAREDTWIGVLPIGYGDGVRRGLTNNGEVLVGGNRYPIVGTVSMDNVTIDLGPETKVEVGDAAVLIGEQGGERILAEEVARRLDTINYEITCGISRRVPREHVK